MVSDMRKGSRSEGHLGSFTVAVLLSGVCLLCCSFFLNGCGGAPSGAAPNANPNWTESNGFLVRGRNPGALQVDATAYWTAFYGTSIEAVWGTPAGSGNPELYPIIFSSDRSGNWEIWGCWSPFGTYVGRLYYKLTNHPASDSTPSGMVFSSDRDGNREIYRVNPDGSNPIRLTNHPADDREPFPDGKYIFFSSNRDGNWEIYRMNMDGTGLTRLTNNSAEDRFPKSDGEYVYFTSKRDGNYEIYRMNLDGSGQTRLTNHPRDDMYPFPWRGDVYFSSNRVGNYEIYRMYSDGSGLTRLTNNPASDTMPAVTGYETDIVYYVSNRSGKWEIWRLFPAGAGEGQITELNATIYWPVAISTGIPLVAPGGSWFPDSRGAYWSALFPSGIAAVVAVHADPSNDRAISSIFAIDAATDESLRVPVFEGYNVEGDANPDVFLIAIEADQITYFVSTHTDSRFLDPLWRSYLIGPDARFDFVSTSTRPITHIVLEFDKFGFVNRVYLGRNRTRSAAGITVRREAGQVIIHGSFEEGWERTGQRWQSIMTRPVEAVRFDIQRGRFTDP
jgi:TolB protein